MCLIFEKSHTGPNQPREGTKEDSPAPKGRVTLAPVCVKTETGWELKEGKPTQCVDTGVDF